MHPERFRFTTPACTKKGQKRAMMKIVNNFCCIEPSSNVCLVNQPRFEIYFDDESGAVQNWPWWDLDGLATGGEAK